MVLAPLIASTIRVASPRLIRPTTGGRNLCSGPSCKPDQWTKQMPVPTTTPPQAQDFEEVLPLQQWRQAKYRLTHMGLKELDEIWKVFLAQIDVIVSQEPPADVELYAARQRWIRRRVEELLELSDIDTYDLWKSLFVYEYPRKCDYMHTPVEVAVKEVMQRLGPRWEQNASAAALAHFVHGLAASVSKKSSG